MENFTEQKTTLGLYDPQFEHDACGIGAVVDIKGRKSHQTVDDALSIVERLEHRAGKDAEGKTGDGVGILLQISHKFFSKVAEELNIRLGNEREYGVGMFFFPQNEHLRAQAMKLFEVVTRKEGLEFLAWREVPVDPDAVGQKARDCMPAIWQCFIKKPAKVSKGIEFDRRLYIVRRVFEQASNGTYVPSLSSRTIVYKGMFLVHDLRRFYADLQDPDYESAIGMVHSRFSTNTNPSWMRAHPNRFILHNGEINTIKGNTDAMLAREESISSPILQDDMNKILPIINTSGSDSAMLDNELEFMVMNGMDLPLAVMITIPDAAPVSSDTEIARIAPVLDALKADGIPVSLDSYQPATQAYALSRGVAYLNDIRGFPDAAFYPQLAKSSAKLVVMHSVQDGQADRREAPAGDIMDHIAAFFDARIAALTGAGIKRNRLVLDPGMGFFLGAAPETSLSVLARFDELRLRFDLPVLLSVSRKSFLRALTGRGPGDVGAATLAAELAAAAGGADFIRTHEPRPLRDGLAVLAALKETARIR